MITLATAPEAPFVGLQPFGPADSLLFFGRHEETIELLQQLHRNRFLAVVGTSGSGKSSLVRAGLIPKLAAGSFLENRDRWLIAALTPGKTPLRNLVQALVELVPGESVDTMLEQIEIAGAGAATKMLAGELAKQDANLLVLVDQFEALFQSTSHVRSAAQRAESSEFVSILLALAEQRDVPIHVAITMRSDYMGECEAVPALAQAMNRSRFLVPRLTSRQCREAIEGPLQVFGGSIAPRLVDRLLNDINGELDQLPVMQHVLMRSWEHARRRQSRVVDLPDYEAVGTIARALSQDANAAMEGMGREQAALTERLFRCLVSIDDNNRHTRRRCTVSDLEQMTGHDGATILAVVECFRTQGRSFLNLSGDGAASSVVVEISHDSLIRRWDRLAEWAGKEARSVGVYRSLAADAELHAQARRSLWRSPELQVGQQWHAENRPTETWARHYDPSFERAMRFLDQSTRDDRRGRRNRRLLISAATIVAIGASFVIAVLGWQRTDQERRVLQRELDRLQTENSTASGDFHVLRETNRALRWGILKLDEENRHLEGSISAAVEANRQLSGRVEELSRTIAGLNTDISTQEQTNKQLAVQQDLLRRRVARAEDEVKALLTQNRRLRDQAIEAGLVPLEAPRQEIATQGALFNSIQNLTRPSESLLLDSVSDPLADLRAQLKNALDENNTLTTVLGELLKENRRLEAEEAAKRERNRDLKARLAGLQSNREKLQAQVASLTAQERSLSESLTDLRAEAARITADVEVLSDQADKAEQYAALLRADNAALTKAIAARRRQ